MDIIELPDSTIPGKISAALAWCRFCEDLKNPSPQFDGSKITPRKLSSTEAACYNSAVELINRYFRGEIDFPPVSPSKNDEDDPEEKAPVDAKI